MKNISENKIIIATGGTGGHVIPAYSLAKDLIKKNFDVKIITDSRGLVFLEKFKDVKLIINNSSTVYGKNILKILFSSIRIIISVINSLIILFRIKPFLIFGMGGYASFPVCIAAKLLKIPFIIYENNLLIGKSNKYLLPLATKILISYDEIEGLSEKFKNKIVRTGNILREEILNFIPKSSKFNNNLKILVLGGSQAAKVFGEVLPTVFEKCKQQGIDLEIIQQCIKSQNDYLAMFYKKIGIKFELFNFTNEIVSYYAKADLVITRSGSSVTAELINCKIPFISIPYPFSADSHQEKNANYLEKKGYCFLIRENEIQEKLFFLIKSVNQDREILNNIVKKQLNHTDKNVFSVISNEIKIILDEKNSAR